MTTPGIPPQVLTIVRYRFELNCKLLFLIRTINGSRSTSRFPPSSCHCFRDLRSFRIGVISASSQACNQLRSSLSCLSSFCWLTPRASCNSLLRLRSTNSHCSGHAWAAFLFRPPAARMSGVRGGCSPPTERRSSMFVVTPVNE